MLIINADDLGRDARTTDAILACYKRQRLTSASAMVFMADSQRAATLAQASGMDVGLHINLSEQFTDPSVPARLSELHRRICRFLKASKYALLAYHPLLRDAFRHVFKAQHAEFVRLYGREPSHFDGHQHMHLATNMLLQRLMPAGTRVRRSFSFRTGEKSLVNRAYRSTVDRCLARRHPLTDYFFSLTHHSAPDSLSRIFELARCASVELMTHPAKSDDYACLMDDAFPAVLGNVETGAFKNGKVVIHGTMFR